MLKPGLYEKVVNKETSDEITKSLQSMLVDTMGIDGAQEPRVLSGYLARVIEKGLAVLPENERRRRLELVNRIVQDVSSLTGDVDFDRMRVNDPAKLLLAAAMKMNNPDAFSGKISTPRPETSLAQSSLFTGAEHEPQLMTELKKEIASADQINMLVSFIRWSGLSLIFDELQEFTNRGGKLRVITTSYMGATQLKAVEELSKLPNTEIKISYDTKRTRLHAKSYVFSRETGFSTAYVGSSNMSNAAMTSGLEWNLKITTSDQPYTIDKIQATFESYWNSSDFVRYTHADRSRLLEALKSEQTPSEDTPYLFDIRPFPYQQEILDHLEAERSIRGYYRNLVVAATGTGKTVISAFDYRRFRQKERKANLLFIAHRKEILKQSQNCFRGVLRDANFGEPFYGGQQPSSWDHLFMSIDTFNSQKFYDRTEPDFYDFIIVDEFHHASAPSYQRLLEYYKPKILLGLTATPERMDGKDVTSYFDNRIAAEIRLPEAVNRKLLCPFHYFGVSDGVDLSQVKWTRGRYDPTTLSELYTGNDQRTAQIIEQLNKYTADLDDVKGLGFCVTKEHARYMARKFNEAHIPSLALTDECRKDERDTAQRRLGKGEIRFIFAVDLYNEGVDIPEINTVMFLRPTESLTVFLQQLGRGLRLAEGKECLTVLDFIGQAHAKYNFASKFAALLGNTRRSVKREIEKDFPLLPKGCYIKLEKQARSYILENIEKALRGQKRIVENLKTFKEETGKDPTFAHFLKHYNLDPRSIYKTKNSFARLCVNAGIIDDFEEEVEGDVTKALPRLANIDSRRLIEFVCRNLPFVANQSKTYTELQMKMWNMLQFTIWQKSYKECGFKDQMEGFRKIADSPNMLKEIIDLLNYKYEEIDFIDEKVNVDFECPLDVHCSYSRDQILVALDFMKPSSIREGVKYLEEKKTDILFVTLNKSDADYSPTTMYKDYSIDCDHFHWQSQSTTAENSKAGQRYINQPRDKTHVMIFVRENRQDQYGNVAPYTFLGLADYVEHKGSKPMDVIWKLRTPIPAKYLKQTSQLIGG